MTVERMKCEFDSTGIFSILYQISILSAIFSCSAVFAFNFRFPIGAGISFIILILSMIALIITLNLKSGIICAIEDKVIITHIFLSKSVFVSAISYEDIKCAEYNVKALHSRLGFCGYEIILTITEKTENEFKITAAMNIDEHMPTEKPDEYKKYLNEQPLVKMCRFINERARKF